jgi:hypothetical protein
LTEDFDKWEDLIPNSKLQQCTILETEDENLLFFQKRLIKYRKEFLPPRTLVSFCHLFVIEKLNPSRDPDFPTIPQEMNIRLRN